MVIPIDIPNECNPGDDLLYGKNLEPGCRFIKQKDAIEFPQYNYDRFNAKPYRYVYGSAIQNDKGSTVGVVRVDTKNRETIVWSKDNEEQICAEPVFIGAPDGVAEDDGKC
ncbi:unnamed protein product [Toxocara canis]|uniref:Peptidase S1 domain-containing protein n=1 Tax=Toxocara canis TaxID=6265 RepID=A0A183U327_TOXCA|nr:unnamed protein product [Toxocara canis]